MIGLKYLDHLDADDWYGDDAYLGGFGYSPPRPPRCRRCRKGGGSLWWVNGEKGWRLHDSSGPHVCPPPPAHTEFSAINTPE